MSRHQSLRLEAKRDPAPWQAIPEDRRGRHRRAVRAGRTGEIDRRLAPLRAELPAVEDWDGDTRDEIHRAMHMFREIARLARQRPD